MHPIGRNSGLSVYPKDTTMDWKGARFEPLTLWLLDNLLWRLSPRVLCSCPFLATQTEEEENLYSVFRAYRMHL